MLRYLENIQAPSDDKRWETVAATMRKLGNQRSALIEALHTLQEAFGRLDKPGLEFVATSLRLPLSQVYGTATFYQHFTLKPRGKHTCVICNGSACQFKGADRLLEGVRENFGVGDGETTANGELTILTARCFGTCGLAPMAVIDGEMSDPLTPETLNGMLEGVMSKP
ncbi:MAG TPA: NAD(P)H-dependent oxidoreductase subunit E [Bryobacteraceae bacterium]|nr:NAD(P)H-dependent oxidoreductase subunit E [Bryobacteraceae bacterium]